MKPYILLVTSFIEFLIKVEKKKKPVYEIWKNWTSNLKILEVGGVEYSNKKRRQLGPNAVGYIFIGYSLNSVTYRFLVINSEILEISNNPT